MALAPGRRVISSKEDQHGHHRERDLIFIFNMLYFWPMNLFLL